MKIFSAEQLYEADKITLEKQQITSAELMERAGEQVFQWLHQRLNAAQVPIHIFCGIGNNGGDGLVVGRLLIQHGYNVHTYVVNCSDKRSKNFLINYDKIKNVSKKWPALMKSEADFPQINSEDIIVDAIFGIGLNRCPDGWVKKLIQYLNESNAYKLAIDIPSGLYANMPLDNAEAVLKANFTVTFQTPKMAFFLPETAKFAPNFDVIDIGLDESYLNSEEPLAQIISKPQAQKFYKPREKFTHKNTYGHVAIVAGSYGKMGAAVLSSTAAFRVGAGLVTAYVPKCGYQILQNSLPEAMVVSDKNETILSEIKFDFEPNSIAIGMGIGKDEITVSALKHFLSEVKVPLIIDADSLNILSENKKLLKHIPKNAVLTPHPGELKRLIGPWKNDYDKLEKTKKFSNKHKVIVLIKGSYSITVYGDKLYVNTSGNPGMATAGSGDALSGVIAGLLSQNYDPLLATVFGVYLHGLAGDIAAQDLGYEALMAGDIIDAISQAYLELFTKPEEEEKGQ
ncbi:NAD(P)H-hydrate dehydratase [Aequorivita echinoideorum]|uniref:Bifunctional NAD(P)H-hydrate repair enzyme n=1 Tax=Aequorivita echinoideorum TaxID=1549647 RepID=A0ABS5S691_9FLAO|nr:NAD(P)H-hydrate dehydratase [Aequorivita echinoideorum]MBT0608732.1 NAD(P)H-hydrate dehydratase [Aequorivita echinoideorum]